MSEWADAPQGCPTARSAYVRSRCKLCRRGREARAPGTRRRWRRSAFKTCRIRLPMRAGRPRLALHGPRLGTREAGRCGPRAWLGRGPQHKRPRRWLPTAAGGLAAYRVAASRGRHRQPGGRGCHLVGRTADTNTDEDVPLHGCWPADGLDGPPHRGAYGGRRWREGEPPDGAQPSLDAGFAEEWRALQAGKLHWWLMPVREPV